MNTNQIPRVNTYGPQYSCPTGVRYFRVRQDHSWLMVVGGANNIAFDMSGREIKLGCIGKKYS